MSKTQISTHAQALHHITKSTHTTWSTTTLKLLHQSLQTSHASNRLEQMRRNRLRHLLYTLVHRASIHRAFFRQLHLLHFPHHLRHHLVLRDELIHVAVLPSRTSHDAIDAARLAQHLHVFLRVRVVELLRGHAVHERHVLFYVRRRLLVTTTSHHVRHAREHGHHLRHRPHLLDIRELIVQETQRERTLRQLLHHLLLRLLWNDVRDFIHQALEVTQTEQAADERLRLEWLELVHVFARADEADWRPRRGDRAERSATLGVPIHFCDDDAPDVHRVPKSESLVVCRLSHGPVHDVDDVVGLHDFADVSHFLEQRALLLVPSRRVDDDDVHLFRAKSLDALLRDLHGVSFRVASEERDTRLRRVLLELVERTCTERVCANHRHLESLPLVVVRVLGARRRLPVALQSHEHDDGLFSFFGYPWLPSVHETREFLEHRLLKDSLRVEPGLQVLEIERHLHVGLELFHEAHVHVSLEERGAYFLQARVHDILVHLT
mmetsp:Transcript_10358/g.27824  ORF Transcript_10358/g.27824 Transcript_10358/m.27824 type:complete len:493 (+) Transcript_10358:37-1515(+)